MRLFCLKMPFGTNNCFYRKTTDELKSDGPMETKSQQITENYSKGGKNNWLRAFRKVKNTKCRCY